MAQTYEQIQQKIVDLQRAAEAIERRKLMELWRVFGWQSHTMD